MQQQGQGGPRHPLAAPLYGGRAEDSFKVQVIKVHEKRMNVRVRLKDVKL